MGLRLAVTVWSVVGLVQASDRTPVTASRPIARSALPDASRSIARLVAQAARLEDQGKLPEAAAAAQGALSAALRSGQKPQTLGNLHARLARLYEKRAEWPAAQEARAAVLVIRVKLYGKDNWQAIDAQRAFDFARKVNGLDKERAKQATAALRKIEEAIDLDDKNQHADAERVALEAAAIDRSLFGPQTPELAPIWQIVGRERLFRHDPRGAKAALEQALALQQKSLPPAHPHLGRTLSYLGIAEKRLGNRPRARELAEQALREEDRLWLQLFDHPLEMIDEPVSRISGRPRSVAASDSRKALAGRTSGYEIHFSDARGQQLGRGDVPNVFPNALYFRMIELVSQVERPKACVKLILDNGIIK